MITTYNKRHWKGSLRATCLSLPQAQYNPGMYERPLPAMDLRIRVACA